MPYQPSSGAVAILQRNTPGWCLAAPDYARRQLNASAQAEAVASGVGDYYYVGLTNCSSPHYPVSETDPADLPGWYDQAQRFQVPPKGETGQIKFDLDPRLCLGADSHGLDYINNGTNVILKPCDVGPLDTVSWERSANGSTYRLPGVALKLDMMESTKVEPKIIKGAKVILLQAWGDYGYNPQQEWVSGDPIDVKQSDETSTLTTEEPSSTVPACTAPTDAPILTGTGFATASVTGSATKTMSSAPSSGLPSYPASSAPATPV